MSVILAAFILLSTSPFMANMHFCCNELVDIAFFGKADTCQDNVQKKDNLFKKCTSFQEKDCCNDQTFEKESNIALNSSASVLDTTDLVFLKTFIYSYINLFGGLDKNIVPFEAYKPPLLSIDIQTLYETYLI